LWRGHENNRNNHYDSFQISGLISFEVFVERVGLPR